MQADFWLAGYLLRVSTSSILTSLTKFAFMPSLPAAVAIAEYQSDEILLKDHLTWICDQGPRLQVT